MNCQHAQSLTQRRDIPLIGIRDGVNVSDRDPLTVQIQGSAAHQDEGHFFGH